VKRDKARLHRKHPIPSSFDAGLVTVIMPTFNRDSLIATALASVSAQDYRPLEVIIVDDGSTDATAGVVERFVGEHEMEGVKWFYVRQANRGPAAARNHGLGLCSGQYIQFLDSDDTLHPCKIRLQVEHARAKPGQVVYGEWVTVYRCGDVLSPEHAGNNPRIGCDLVEEYLAGRFIAAHAILWPRETLVDLGGWDESFAAYEDGDLLLRSAMGGWKLSFCDGSIATYYRDVDNEDNVSKRRSEAAYRSQLRYHLRLEGLLAAKGYLEPYIPAFERFFLGRAISLAMVYPRLARFCLAHLTPSSPRAKVRRGLAWSLLWLHSVLSAVIGQARATAVLGKVHSIARALRVKR